MNELQTQLRTLLNDYFHIHVGAKTLAKNQHMISPVTSIMGSSDVNFRESSTRNTNYIQAR